MRVSGLTIINASLQLKNRDHNTKEKRAAVCFGYATVATQIVDCTASGLLSIRYTSGWARESTVGIALVGTEPDFHVTQQPDLAILETDT
jgi:hypothetical protein